MTSEEIMKRIISKYKNDERTLYEVLGWMPEITKDNIDAVLGICPPEILEALSQQVSRWAPNPELSGIHFRTSTEEENRPVKEWLRSRSLFPPAKRDIDDD